MNDRRTPAAAFSSLIARGAESLRSASDDLSCVVDGMPSELPNTLDTLRAAAADLRARAATASSAANRLSAVASSFDTLAGVLNASSALPGEPSPQALARKAKPASARR